MSDDHPRYRVMSRSWWVYPEKEGAVGDFTTSIEIDDEGAGEYLLIKQPFASSKLSAGGVAISPEEWPAIRDAISAAFGEIEANASEK